MSPGFRAAVVFEPDGDIGLHRLVHLPREKRATAFVASIELEVDGVFAEGIDLHAGDIGDDLDGVRLRVGGHRDGNGNLHRGHDELAVVVADDEPEPFLADLVGIETQLHREAAMWMHGGHLAGEDGVEDSDDTQFAAVVGGEIGEGEQLNFHAEKYLVVG
jgi:hypothetical protein